MPKLKHPFTDPTDCPHSADYRDDHHSRYWCDENEDEYIDAVYGVV
jgi:hypothetical protein